MRSIAIHVAGLMLTLAAAAGGAPMENVPIRLAQPDGDTVYCFTSGDEFFHRVHDKDGYTLVRDTVGQVVYADTADGELVATSYTYESVDPAKVGLMPGLGISPERYYERRDAYPEIRVGSRAVHFGTLNNICIFVRFAGEDEFDRPRSYYDSLFNSTQSGHTSFKAYYLDNSYDNLTIQTHMYPLCDLDTNLSFQSPYPRIYYQPYDPSVGNYSGYLDTDERIAREIELYQMAVQSIDGQVPGNLNIDADDDERIDNICFVIYGDVDGWNDLLWPHSGGYTQDIWINGIRMNKYTLQLDDRLGAYVLVHEMGHALGAPDLYRYNATGYDPVAGWDPMASAHNPPQHMSAWVKHRYLEWIPVIPELVAHGGYYELEPLSIANGYKAWSVMNWWNPNEFFVVEYRLNTGLFESTIYDEGLIVYRVDSTVTGNAWGPPDELYVYRPGGTLLDNGIPQRATLRADSGRYAITNYTDPRCFRGDDSDGNLFIADVGPAGGATIEFYCSPHYRAHNTNVFDGSGAPWEDVDDHAGYVDYVDNHLYVPEDHTLTVESGARVYCRQGSRIESNGQLRFLPGSKWSRLLNVGRYKAGIKSRGEILFSNGGQIRFK